MIIDVDLDLSLYMSAYILYYDEECTVDISICVILCNYVQSIMMNVLETMRSEPIACP